MAAHPESAAARFALAYAETGLGQDAQAIGEYQAGLKINPRDFAAQLNLGILLRRGGQATSAVSALENATTLGRSAKAWLELGRAEQQSGDWAAALHAWQQAEALDAGAEAPWLEAGSAALQRKDYVTAQAQLQGALQRAPADVNALAALADLYSATARTPQAEAMLRDYLRQQPKDARAHLALARLLANDHRAGGARAEFRAALALAPGDLQAEAELARLDLTADDTADAIAEYRQLAAAQPQAAEWRRGLGEALLRARQYAAARGELAVAVAQMPNDGATWGDLAFADYKLKDYSQALAALERHGQLAGDDAASYFLRAVCWDELHQSKQAIEYYQKFLAADQNRDPDDAFKARHRLIALQPKR